MYVYIHTYIFNTILKEKSIIFHHTVKMKD